MPNINVTRTNAAGGEQPLEPGYSTGEYTPSYRREYPWQWWVIIGIILFAALLAVGSIVYRWLSTWALMHAVLIDQLGYLIISLVMLLIIAGVFSFGKWTYFWAETKRADALQARIVRSRLNNPVDVTVFTQPKWLEKAQFFYHIEQGSQQLEESIAPHRRYRGVEVLTEGNTTSETLTTQLQPREESAPATIVQAATGVNKLEELKQQGFIGRSQNAWTLGFDKSLGAIGESSLILANVGKESQHSVYAVAGSSGSGKTSYVRWLLAQAAMNGSALVVCDPQGNMQNGKQTLIQSLGNAISKNFLIPPAVTNSEIYEAFALVDKLGRARSDGTTDTNQHILLVVDEFNDIARNHPQMKEIAKCLKNIANTYRKVNITILLVVHNWRVTEWKDSTARDAIQAIIALRMDKGEANLAFKSLEDNTTLVNRVGGLVNGDAVFWAQGREAVWLTGIPFIAREDMEAAAHLYRAVQAAVYSNMSAEVAHNERSGAEDDLLESLLSSGGEGVREDISSKQESKQDSNVLSKLPREQKIAAVKMLAVKQKDGKYVHSVAKIRELVAMSQLEVATLVKQARERKSNEEIQPELGK